MLISTSDPYPTSLIPQAYNALDCTITFSVFEAIAKQLTPETQGVYDFERGLQRTALLIMLRGVRIDKTLKIQKGLDLERSLVPLRDQFNLLCKAAVGSEINPNSPKQVQQLFYTCLRVVPIYSYKSGHFTTDDKALNKIRGRGGIPGFLAKYITTLRKTQKLISTLKAETDEDGRMRENINISGTETGRWSSSKPVYGRGGMSGQNITEGLRDMFIADPNQVFIYVDLDQAESRVVGLLAFRDSGVPTYLDACESGDIHTEVCRMAWPEKAWNPDLKKSRLKAEEMILNPPFSYRDIAKRVGHGTNYMGSPNGISHEVKVPPDLIKDFQARYFRAFPDLKVWHNMVVRKLQVERSLTTLLGRKRYFFNRAYESSTIKEAIAYEPQSVVGDTTNKALYLATTKGIMVLKNLHDGGLFQAPLARLDETVAMVQECFNLPLTAKGKEMVIPIEVKCGFNWGVRHSGNPNGLRPWQKDLTLERAPLADILNLRL